MYEHFAHLPFICFVTGIISEQFPTSRVTNYYIGHIGVPKGFQPLNLLCLPGKLLGTSQLKCFSWATLLHGGHSWKWRHLFKDKPH